MSWSKFLLFLILFIAFLYSWKYISPFFGDKSIYVFWLIILVLFLYFLNHLKHNLTTFPITTNNISGKQLYTKSFNYLPNSSEDFGFGFTLGFKILINDWDYRFNQEKIVIQQSSNYNVVLDAKTNKLTFNIAIFPTNGQQVVSIPIEDIPLNTWNSFMIIVQDRNIDIWQKINTPQLIVSLNSPNVFKINNDKKFMIGVDGGFGGELKDVVYYSYPLFRNEILNEI